MGPLGAEHYCQFFIFLEKWSIQTNKEQQQIIEKQKSHKEKAQRKERFEKRSKDADGLEEAVVAGNLGKRRKSGVCNASES